MTEFRQGCKKSHTSDTHIYINILIVLVFSGFVMNSEKPIIIIHGKIIKGLYIFY